MGKPWMSDAAFSNLAWAGCQLRARITGLATERCAPVPQVDNSKPSANAQLSRPRPSTPTRVAGAQDTGPEDEARARASVAGARRRRPHSPGTWLPWVCAKAVAAVLHAQRQRCRWRRRIRDSRVEPLLCTRMGSNAPTAAEVAAKLNSPQSSETPLPRHIPTAIKACPPSRYRSGS